MTGHRPRFGWPGELPRWRARTEGAHRAPADLTETARPRPPLRLTEDDYRSGVVRALRTPLRQRALAMMSAAVISTGLGIWFGAQAWRPVGNTAHVAMVADWVALVAYSARYGVRQRREILADPQRHLVTVMRRAVALRGGRFPSFGGARPGAGEPVDAIISGLPLTRRRLAVATNRQAFRFRAQHGLRGTGLTWRGYLLGTVFVLASSVPSALDPAVNAMQFIFSALGGFTPLYVLQALALWECHKREARAAAAGAPSGAAGLE